MNIKYIFITKNNLQGVIIFKIYNLYTKKKQLIGRNYFYKYKIYTYEKLQLKTVIIFINIKFIFIKKNNLQGVINFYKN